MKAIEALNKVWNTLHDLESQLTKGIGKIEEVSESKRLIERMLMLLGMVETHISRDTEL